MPAAKAGMLTLRTPEGIAFSLPLASPVVRFLAWACDCACILAASILLNKLLTAVGFVNRGLAQAAVVLLYFAISVGYGIAFEWYWRGQTIGKRLLRLRVMDSAGLHLQFSQVVVRNLLRFVDALPALYLVGGTVCLLLAALHSAWAISLPAPSSFVNPARSARCQPDSQRKI